MVVAVIDLLEQAADAAGLGARGREPVIPGAFAVYTPVLAHAGAAPGNPKKLKPEVRPQWQSQI